MQQIFLILLLVLGGASYWLYNENQTLKMKQIKKFTYNNLVSKDEYNKIKNKSFSEQCRDLK